MTWHFLTKLPLTRTRMEDEEEDEDENEDNRDLDGGDDLKAEPPFTSTPLSTSSPFLIVCVFIIFIA